MSFEVIALIILFGSLIGMGIIILRKIPAVAELPEISSEHKQNLFSRLKNKITNIHFVKEFNFLLFLQKILSRIMVLTLKIENKVASWLQKLREKSQKQKIFEDDNYWKRLKNLSVNKSDKKSKTE